VTPGALYGVAAAILLLLVVAGMPRTTQLALMGFALMAATALVNLAPANPYMTASSHFGNRGIFSISTARRASFPRVAVCSDGLSGSARRRPRTGEGVGSAPRDARPPQYNWRDARSSGACAAQKPLLPVSRAAQLAC